MARTDPATPAPDPAIVRAASALAACRPLPALAAIAERDDPEARALRGIALAQLGELGASRLLLEGAARAFARRRMPLERARCLAAAGEVAAAERDLGGAERLLRDAVAGLQKAGDGRNAAWALLVHARVEALFGRERRARSLLRAARRGLPRPADATLRAGFALTRAETSLRRLDVSGAARSLRRSLVRPLGGLGSEIAAVAAALSRTVAVARDPRRAAGLSLDAFELARVIAGKSAALAAFLGARRPLVVDRIARRVFFAGGGRAVRLSRRPVLAALLARLAAAWPKAAAWRDIARDVFDLDLGDDSIRFRAKVAIDRLRRLLPAGARVVAERNAWRLAVPSGSCVAILDPAGPADEGLLRALLADGAAWSARDLATASGRSASSVRRELRGLVANGRVAARGSARARRYVATTPAGIASQMLLVGLARPKGGCAST